MTHCKIGSVHWNLGGYTMKARYSSLSGILSLLIVLVSMSIRPVYAAGTILHYATVIPADAVFDGTSLAAGTPFAVYGEITGAPANTSCNGPKLRLLPTSSGGTADSTFRTWTGERWLTDSGAWAQFPAITTDDTGSWSGWAYAAVPSSATNTFLEFRINCGGGNHSSTRVSISILDMSTDGNGGWIEEVEGAARAGRAVAVRSGATLIGLYVAEDNDINEGYPPTPGYYKVAVPVCNPCNYSIETWELDAPGTAVGQVNTMPDINDNNTVAAGQATTLTFDLPTAVQLTTLQTTAAAIPAVVFAAVVLLLTGTAVVLRRRP
jgi:hypothetical protein